MLDNFIFSLLIILPRRKIMDHYVQTVENKYRNTRDIVSYNLTKNLNKYIQYTHIIIYRCHTQQLTKTSLR